MSTEARGQRAAISRKPTIVRKSVKRPFDIDEVIKRLRNALKTYDAAAMFVLADEGYVSAGSPERTKVQLEERLPRKYWLEINKLLVPFGKHVCTGGSPKCSTCPLLEFCRQVGVTSHR